MEEAPVPSQFGIFIPQKNRQYPTILSKYCLKPLWIVSWKTESNVPLSKVGLCSLKIRFSPIKSFQPSNPMTRHHGSEDPMDRIFSQNDLKRPNVTDTKVLTVFPLCHVGLSKFFVFAWRFFGGHPNPHSAMLTPPLATFHRYHDHWSNLCDGPHCHNSLWFSDSSDRNAMVGCPVYRGSTGKQKHGF